MAEIDREPSVTRPRRRPDRAPAAGPAAPPRAGSRAAAAVFRALHELAVESGDALDPAELGQVVIRHAPRLLRAAECAFFVAVPGQDRLRAASATQELGEVEVGPGDSAVWQAFVTRTAVIRHGSRGTRNRALVDRLQISSRLAAPLIHRDEVLGVVVCVRTHGARFLAGDRRLMALVADQVAPRLAAARHSTERRRRAAELEALHRLAVVTGGGATADRVAASAVETATALLGDSAALRWWDEARGELLILHETGAGLPPIGPSPSRGGVARRAFEAGRPVLLSLAEARAAAGQRGDAADARAVAVVPLLAGDRAVGTLGVRGDRGGDYGPEAIRLLELIAAQIGPALVAARERVARERANRMLTLLHELAVASSGILDPAALATLVSRHAAEMVGAEAGGVAWAEAGGALTLLSDTGAPQLVALRSASERGVLGMAYRSGQPSRAENYRGAIGPDVVPGVEIASAMAVPLLIGDSALGALGVRTAEERRFGAEDERSLVLLAAQVAPALQAAKEHRELERRTAAMRALNELAFAVSGVLDEGRIVSLAAARVEALLAAGSVTMTWLDAGSEAPRVVAGGEAEAAAGLAFSLQRTVTVDSALAVPLRVAERVVGALGVAAAGRDFGREDAEVLTLVAGQLAPVFEAARLHGDLGRALGAAGRREQEQRAVAELGRIALSGLSIEELTGRATAAVELLLGARAEVRGEPVEAGPESLVVPVGPAHAPTAWLAVWAGARPIDPEDRPFLDAVAAVVSHALARRATEDELRERGRELRTVLDHAGIALFVLDAEGRVVLTEGSEPDRVELGRSTAEARRAEREALDGRFAAYALQQDGRELDVALHPVVEADGSVARVIGIVTDITDRLRAEAAHRESEAKSRFLAAMSHEFRTPLNAVLGFAQLLAMDPNGDLTARQRRYLDNIARSGRHLLGLVNDILDISRVAAGQMTVHMEAVTLGPALVDVLERMRPLAAAKELRLALEADPEAVAAADRRRLEQVVVNLVSNAIKFTPAGGNITVRAAREPDAVVVAVSDDGIGIPPLELERIFDEFTQVESSSTRNHEGTGLGLSLSRRLAELMGGTISVRSEVGSGSEFTLRLRPAAQAAGGDRTATRPAEAAQPH